MNLLSGNIVGFQDIEAMIFEANDKGKLKALARYEIKGAQAQFNSVGLIERNDNDLEGNRVQTSACMLKPGQTIQCFVFSVLELTALAKVLESADVRIGHKEGEDSKEALIHHDRAPIREKEVFIFLT